MTPPTMRERSKWETPSSFPRILRLFVAFLGVAVGVVPEEWVRRGLVFQLRNGVPKGSRPVVVLY